MEQKEQKKPLKLKKSTKRSLFALGFLLIGLLLVLAGSSYAYLVATTKQQDQNIVKVGNLEINYLDTGEGLGNQLNINNAFPVSDATGMAGTGYTFRITNTGTLPVHYKVQILNDDAAIASDGCTGKLLPLNNLRVSINGGSAFTLGSLEGNQYVVDSNLLAAGESRTYEVKMWIKEDSGNEILGTHYHGKVVVSGTQGYQDGSGATSPVVIEGMIPVTYDETSKNWVKADPSSAWYDYSNQMWANAVTVSETNRASYMRATSGTTISMDDIQTMWVWIPRYEYQYTNLGTQYAGGSASQPGEIKINFIDASTTSPSDSSNYKVHPAFTFGEKELSGFWYAKFETSSSDPHVENYGGGNTSDLDPYIKPNITSWRGINISNIFTVGRKLTASGNIYGLSTSADSHASKNSEWGAVAYLSQSKYGKYGNSSFSGVNKEVYVNNYGETTYWTTLTGCSGGIPSASTSATCAYTYEVPISGTGASTSGTIYGVYDMSGGAWERVMGNLNNMIDSSGLSAIPEKKYYDLYSSNNLTSNDGSLSATACDGGICYGHALSETAGWYSDYQSMISADNPWFIRGGFFSYSSGAGVFDFGFTNGDVDNAHSFRLVLAP